MSTLENRLEETRFRSSGFDYLRLFLATSVIVVHSVDVASGAQAALAVWGGWAKCLVQMILPMFFALSGFLVAGSLERSRSMIGFVGLRLLRLIPALAVEVMLSAVILGPLFTSLPLGDYVTDPKFRAYFLNMVGKIHYTLPGVFAANPHPDTVNGQLWTLPFELKCYLGLVAVAGIGLLVRRTGTVLTCVTVQAAIVAYQIFLANGRNDEGFALIGAFFAGLMLFRLRRQVAWNGKAALGCAVVTAALLASHPLGIFLTPFPVAYMTVYLGLLNPPRHRLLLSGDYSYGLYLYGLPIQQAVSAASDLTHRWWLGLALSWPLAFGCAAFSWWCVEKPAQRGKWLLYALENEVLKNRLFGAYNALIKARG